MWLMIEIVNVRIRGAGGGGGGGGISPSIKTNFIYQKKSLTNSKIISKNRRKSLMSWKLIYQAQGP